MIRTFAIGAMLAAMTAAASAQTPPAQPSPNNSAVNTSEANTATAPVEGANSFTEGQAKSRIADKGFTNVSALTKDDKGIWRGTAQRSGQTVDVSLDFQGNVFPR